MEGLPKSPIISSQESLEVKKYPNSSWKQKFLRMGIFLSAFLAAHEGRAQGKHPVVITSDTGKVNAYLDSLDIYNAFQKTYSREKGKFIDTVEKYNKTLSEGQTKATYEEKIVSVDPKDVFEKKGKRSGVSLSSDKRIEIDARNIPRYSEGGSYPYYEEPVQPYELGEPISAQAIVEINASNKKLEYYVRVHDFDPSLVSPKEPKVIQFENEQQRQQWLKENVSHLQREGGAGVDFLDIDTIPNKGK